MAAVGVLKRASAWTAESTRLRTCPLCPQHQELQSPPPFAVPKSRRIRPQRRRAPKQRPIASRRDVRRCRHHLPLAAVRIPKRRHLEDRLEDRFPKRSHRKACNSSSCSKNGSPQVPKEFTEWRCSTFLSLLRSQPSRRESSRWAQNRPTGEQGADRRRAASFGRRISAAGPRLHPLRGLQCGIAIETCLGSSPDEQGAAAGAHCRQWQNLAHPSSDWELVNLTSPPESIVRKHPTRSCTGTPVYFNNHGGDNARFDHPLLLLVAHRSARTQCPRQRPDRRHLRVIGCSVQPLPNSWSQIAHDTGDWTWRDLT